MFADRIKLKMHIDELTRRVRASLRPAGTSRHLDRDAMRELLQIGNYRQHCERDMELYLPSDATQPCDIVVLDNDLSVYHSTITDVLMRKSPTIKEMISIRNAIKILNDSAIRVRTQQQTLDHIHSQCIDTLDLQFTRADLEQLSLEGRAALDGHDSELVIEVLSLFAELTGYQPPPSALRIPGWHIFGRRHQDRFGPSMAYGVDANMLLWIEQETDLHDRQSIDAYGRIMTSNQRTPEQGMAVFQLLANQVTTHCAAPYRLRRG